MSGKRKEEQALSDKTAYLSFVQSNIARMSNYSCAIKGSCCAAVVAELALLQQAEIEVSNCPLCIVLLVSSVLAFSLFDARYLQLERQNRALYKQIDEAGASYRTDMKVPEPCSCNGTRWRDAYLSWSVLGFYLTLGLLGVFALSLVL